MFLKNFVKNDFQFSKNDFFDIVQNFERNFIFHDFETTKMIDEMSKRNHFLNEILSKNKNFNALIFSIAKILHSTSTTNVANEKILMTIEKNFRKKNKKSLFRKTFRKIDANETSNLHRFVNVENCENFVFVDVIKTIFNKNSTLTVSSLKLRNVFFIFQKIDFFATRIRFQTTNDVYVKSNINENVDVEKISNQFKRKIFQISKFE